MNRRWWACGAAVVTVTAGLAVRALTDGAFAKCAGDALYTVLVYLVVVLIMPALSDAAAAGIAFCFSWAVEFLQIAGVPAPLRPLLGSTFNAPDLFWYAVGAGFCWAASAGIASRRAAARRRAGQRSRPGAPCGPESVPPHPRGPASAHQR